MPANTAWLTALKAGDQVFVTTRYHNDELRTVERTTTTQIILTQDFNRRFRRRDGWQTGGGSSRQFLRQWTPEREAAWRAEQTVKSLHQRIYTFCRQVARMEIERLTQPQCEAVLRLLAEVGLWQEQGERV